MLTEFQPRWEDPRPSRTGRAAYWDMAKTRPGEWLLAKIDCSVPNGYKKKWLNSKGFEATARKNENGTYNVYVRYVGSNNDN